RRIPSLMLMLLVCVMLLLQRTTICPLFPYTTLFRSEVPGWVAAALPEDQQLALEAARMDAATPLDVDAVIEASSHVAPPAVEALDRKEHTSELQSRENLVCRLLLEKKKKNRMSLIEN